MLTGPSSNHEVAYESQDEYQHEDGYQLIADRHPIEQLENTHFILLLSLLLICRQQSPRRAKCPHPNLFCPHCLLPPQIFFAITINSVMNLRWPAVL